MAEPTQVQTAPTGSPREIKQEHEHEPTGLEALDFSILAELASKRPFEHVAQDHHDEREQEAKRPKTENPTTEEETSLEDGLALLVQNALSNVGDLVSKFNIETGDAHGSDPMDVDDAHGADARPAPVSFLSEPEKYVRIANTHALGNLQPIDDMSKLAGDADSGYGRSYGRLKRSFDATWQLFSDNQVLSADELEIQEAEARTLLELANIAKFGTWLVEGGLDSFTAADGHFAAVFRCQLSDLSAGLSQLYLGIKTHKTIESLLIRNGDGPSIEEVVQTIMLEGLNEPTDATSEPISASQQELLAAVKSRRDVLVDEVKIKEPAALREKFPTGDVLKSFSAHVRTTLASMTEIGEKLGVSALLSDVANQESIPSHSGDGELDLDDLSSFFEKTTSGLVQNALAGLTEETPTEEPAVVEITEAPVETVNGEPKAEATAPVAAQTNGAKLDLISDYKELEALVAESTSNYVKTTLHGLSAVPYQPTVPQSTAETMAAQSPYLSHLHQHQSHHPYYTSYTTQPAPEQQPPQPTGSSDNLPPNQTFPSAILYDKARQAALSKSSAHTRREGLHSTRRPWTQEEEKALMAGLDMVKGPHWSQILTLFGQNGTISDILKDRTQVQLKDKARNLKLFFLKTNSEMPYYLQAVTGELKTRAPTQAARKEAEERARMNSEEEQAKLQGIMALAGGLQHPPQQQQQQQQQQQRQQLHHQARPPVTVAAAVGQSVVTPAQAASAAQSASSVQQQQQHASHLHHTPTASMASTQQANVTPISRGGMILPNTAQIKPESQMAAVQQASQPVPLAPQRPQTQLPPQVPRPQSQPQPQLQMQQHSPLQQQQQQHPQPQTQVQTHAQALAQVQAHTQMPAPAQAQAQVHHQQVQPSQQPLQQQYHQQPQQSPHIQPSHSPALGQHHQTPSQPGTPIVSTQLQNGTATHSSPTPTIPSTPTPSHLSQHIPTPIQASPAPAYSPQPQQPSIPAQTELHKLVSAPEATMSQAVVQDDEAAAEAALLEGLQAAVAQALAS
ncbi:uncharacterized protein TRIVIDRAFT_65219 [Trichoderma virens Gv29-8]|uniref:HTH myb-type domain-containing protein n=1 Tax=Hypocrea virens (strain Gv29-8 / FGSC 10586) TaxID=413071 RepID=G9NAU5_HYPVG|nr:uncharacterized protein TRIVIDRAFT_65219 [Trichoderma virens Gv29-8]EHK15956.1 hypothetical protein TRIVIDRAFT_65219 [Trichoderma virens Gv29-8]UKZ56269.1 hypothetical protein TrVGV298_010103 [Trichoderma virens]